MQDTTSTPVQENTQGPGPASPEAAGLPWLPIAWYGALLVVLFGPELYTMMQEWSSDDSMGHGFFVPVVSAYIIWQRREQLMNVPVKPHWSGWVLVVLGFVQLVFGTLGAEFTVMRIGFLESLFGILLLTAGPAVLREVAFPLILLLFMIRIPLFIYSQITFPLQLFSSAVADYVLTAIGIPVFREGNILELADHRLSVVEACSGIRSLLSLTFLSLVYGYFFENKTWIRAVLFLSTIPIAIATNAARVSITGIVSSYRREFAEGTYHTFEGWAIFVVALGILFGVHKLIHMIVALFDKKGDGHVSVPAN